MSGSRPKRRLGQHFLSDPAILARIADATGAGPRDVVLEIGPGRGALTVALAARAGRVVAIEKDPDVVPTLKALTPAVTVIEADALGVDWHAAAGAPDPAHFIIAGNIPYNITSPLIDKALEPPRPVRIVFLVQKEVALRVGARPGSEDYGALSVGVQSVARVERLMTVPARAFAPSPRVDSALLRVTPLASPLIEDAERESFRAVVVGLFGFRRKQIARALRELSGWSAAEVQRLIGGIGIDPTLRPEVLDPETFVRIARRLVDGGWRRR